MSVYKDFIPYSIPITHDFFSLVISKQKKHIQITMESLTSLLNTQDVPNITGIIKRYIPQVLFSDCFNYENLPFSQEMKKTEIAHMFEHILLAVLCMKQCQNGNTSAVYDGVTFWNWMKEKKGIFHITITLLGEDDMLFQQALQESIVILEKIYLSHTKHRQKKQKVN
jgi:hypothetical protein